MELIECHLEWCQRRGLRPTYISSVSWTLGRLERDLGPLEDIEARELEQWWNALDIGAGTRSTYAAHVSGFYRWLIREQLRDDDPTLRLIRPRLRRRLPRPIPVDRLTHALQTATSPVDCWLLLAAYMGFRACEIATLHNDDIRDGVVIVREGKGAKQRIVPLHPEVERALRTRPQTGYVFPNNRGEAIKPNTVSQRANRHLHDVGVPDTLHQCRHLFGTAVYRESRDLRLTQELMGHSSPTTTANYAAWEPERATLIVHALRLPFHVAAGERDTARISAASAGCA